MKIRRIRENPGRRLQRGAAILTIAQAVDVRAVKVRVAGFAGAQASYVNAQRKVEAAEAQLRQGQARLAKCDARQDQAVETLARSLAMDGQPRTNPFAAFGAASPSLIKSMPCADEVKAIYALVAAVQESTTVSKVSLQAAQAADKAARITEAALGPLAALELTLSNMRATRDAMGQTWDTALAVLKRGVRAAADDGASGLYTKLFGRPSRPSSKNGKPAPVPQPASPVAA